MFPSGEHMDIQSISKLIFYGIALAMGVATIITANLDTLEIKTVATLLGIGVFCLGLAGLDSLNKK